MSKDEPFTAETTKPLAPLLLPCIKDVAGISDDVTLLLNVNDV